MFFKDKIKKKSTGKKYLNSKWKNHEKKGLRKNVFVACHLLFHLRNIK